MDYRVEQKYIITDDQIALLKMRLSGILQLDPNVKNESYLIRSIYFDDMMDSCLSENESGVDDREKFRIRTYDNSDSRILLELKSKKHGYTAKKSVELTRNEMNALLDRQTIYPSDNMSVIDRDEVNLYLKTKISAEMQYRRLQPVCVVEYERIPFIDSLGNVRITFDMNIGTTREIDTIFDDTLRTIPVLSRGQHILEVKYDEFLPDYIKTILDMGDLTKTAFSKYYYSRVILGEEG